MSSFNLVPSRYEPTGNGRPTRNIPIDNVMGGPVFRISASDRLLQMAHLIAHALLVRQEEETRSLWTSADHAGDVFGILDSVLTRNASHKGIRIPRAWSEDWIGKRRAVRQPCPAD